MATDDGFLSRWSRRKAEARLDTPAPAVPEPAPAAPVAGIGPVVPVAGVGPVVPVDGVEPAPPAAASAAGPAPTLADVDALTADSSYARFVAGDVDAGVRNAALKKLFADPHYNVMDGLDTYIDDYGRPDPLPAAWLRQMTGSRLLGLFTEDPHEDADLRLQPDDGAGRAGAEPGAAPDPGREP